MLIFLCIQLYNESDWDPNLLVFKVRKDGRRVPHNFKPWPVSRRELNQCIGWPYPCKHVCLPLSLYTVWHWLKADYWILELNLVCCTWRQASKLTNYNVLKIPLNTVVPGSLTLLIYIKSHVSCKSVGKYVCPRSASRRYHSWGACMLTTIAHHGYSWLSLRQIWCTIGCLETCSTVNWYILTWVHFHTTYPLLDPMHWSYS